MNPLSSPRRPSLGTVLGFTALIVAIVGTANAAPDSRDRPQGRHRQGCGHRQRARQGSGPFQGDRQGSSPRQGARAGAVNARALATNSVSAATLKPGSVTPPRSRPTPLRRPRSRRARSTAARLGRRALHTAPIADLDEIAANGTWTASNTESATCAPGERLLTGGIVFTNPGNREVGVLESLPFSNATSAGYVGQITQQFRRHRHRRGPGALPQVVAAARLDQPLTSTRTGLLCPPPTGSRPGGTTARNRYRVRLVVGEVVAGAEDARCASVVALRKVIQRFGADGARLQDDDPAGVRGPGSSPQKRTRSPFATRGPLARRLGPAWA